MDAPPASAAPAAPAAPGGGLASLDVARRAERVEVPGGGVDAVVVPRDAGEVAAVVRAAAGEGAGLLVIGGGTRLDHANPADALALGLSTEGLAGIDDFDPDEGVLHAGAGTRLATIRERVAAEGWELPLDAPGPEATVGGTIASAAAGPRAQAFGPVKDAVLGLEVVTGDGLVAKCGGRVVKNVTGYDLAKLYCGSFGTLAVVTGAWLRLRPAPSSRETWRARGPATVLDDDAVRAFAGRASLRALVWQADGAADRATLHVELGGSAEAVAHDATALGEMLGGLAAGIEPERVEGPDDPGAGAAIDALREQRLGGDAPLVLRARVPTPVVFDMARAARAAGLAVSLDVGLGVVTAWGSIGDLAGLEALRAQARAFSGVVTVPRLPARWSDHVDVFGLDEAGEAVVGLMATLTERFDPAGILNPGRFGPARRRVAAPRAGGSS